MCWVTSFAFSYKEWDHLLSRDQIGPGLLQMLMLLLKEGEQRLCSLLIELYELVACQHRYITNLATDRFYTAGRARQLYLIIA